MANVIIVDETGQRHVFPEGFDPKKAAGIVKVQLGKAATDKADALRPKSAGDMNMSQLGEAGKQFGSMLAGGADALQAGSVRARDMFFGLPEAAKKLIDTPPHETVANAARYAVTEPRRIGEQLGEGTPEALGKSAVDAAMYIPGILGLTGAVAGPAQAAKGAVVRGVKAAAKSPITRGLGEAALYTPGVGPMVRGGVRAFKRASKVAAPAAAEAPLLSAEADALRASTQVTGPGVNPQRGTPGPPEARVPAVVDQGQALGVDEAAAQRMRQETAMVPEPNASMQLVQKTADGDWYVDAQGSHHLMEPGSPVPRDTSNAVFAAARKPAARTAQEDQLSSLQPNWNPNVTTSPRMMRSEGLPETLEAEMADRAAHEAQTADLARGSRLKPNLELPEDAALDAAADSLRTERAANTITVEEPRPEPGLRSERGQVSEAQAGKVDPDVERLLAEMRARSQPVPQPAPEGQSGYRTEAGGFTQDDFPPTTRLTTEPPTIPVQGSVTPAEHLAFWKSRMTPQQFALFMTRQGIR